MASGDLNGCEIKLIITKDWGRGGEGYPMPPVKSADHGVYMYYLEATNDRGTGSTSFVLVVIGQ